MSPTKERGNSFDLKTVTGSAAAAARKSDLVEEKHLDKQFMTMHGGSAAAAANANHISDQFANMTVKSYTDED